MVNFQALKKKKELAFINQLRKKFPAAEIFLVGGMIRDRLLGIDSKDYDFVIKNIPVDKLLLFLKNTKGHIDIVGKRFGVLKFTPPGSKQQIDIALPRTEHAFKTGGYKDFQVQSDHRISIEKDLSRRDFTINALAYDWHNNKIIDLYNGLNDLKKKTIKAVGKAEERLKEDYTRILRAIRLACQLGFKIEKNTWSTIKKLTPKINKKAKGGFVVPRETIAKEIIKSFVANPPVAFQLFYQSGLTKQLIPELLKMKGCPQPKNFHSEGDVWRHTLLCLKNLKTKKFQKKFKHPNITPELVIALMLHDIGKPYTIKRSDRLRFNNHDKAGAQLANKIMGRLKLSNGGLDQKKVVWLIKNHMLVTHAKKSPMKKTTLEKYFFNPQTPGQDLLRLMFADIMATIPPNGRPDFSDYNFLEKQIKKISLRQKIKSRQLPPELLDGYEIMKLLRLAPGPEIGRLKNQLREAQLKGQIDSKQQAKSLLKKICPK